MRQLGFLGLWLRDLLIGTTGFLLAWLGVYFLFYLYRRRVKGEDVRALPSVFACAAVIFIFCLPYPAFLLELPLRLWSARLEAQHSVELAASAPDDAPGTGYVVMVLGGGVIEPGRLNSQSLKRLDYGIGIWRELGDAQLLLTEGGLGRKGGDGGAFARRYIECHGIPSERVFVETAAATTRQNMVYGGQLIQESSESRTVVLVTSSRHMPRSYLAARRVGLVPAVSPVDTATDLRFLPRWQALNHLSAVLNEYAGLIGYFLADWI